LVFELYKYDFSLKKQFISDKKLYVIDNGLRNVISFYFSEDLGKSLENLVFLELKRRGNEIYYYKNKKECDFLIKDKARIIQAIQVSKDIEPGKNKDRELGGLMEAMAEFNLKEGTILTQFQEDSFQENGYTVNIVPIWKWLLDRDA
ncbi:DUF4143 domain-containing protein, partial [Patescibacteria group bacterium]|nr:DUF4143 domain-containing protein [Patescibacteria group bacterium]